MDPLWKLSLLSYYLLPVAEGGGASGERGDFGSLAPPWGFASDGPDVLTLPPGDKAMEEGKGVTSTTPKACQNQLHPRRKMRNARLKTGDLPCF